MAVLSLDHTQMMVNASVQTIQGTKDRSYPLPSTMQSHQSAFHCWSCNLAAADASLG